MNESTPTPSPPELVPDPWRRPPPLPRQGRLELSRNWQIEGSRTYEALAVGHGWVLVDDGKSLAARIASTGERVNECETCACDGYATALHVMDEHTAWQVCKSWLVTFSLPDFEPAQSSYLLPRLGGVAMTQGLVAYSHSELTNVRRPPHYTTQLVIMGEASAGIEFEGAEVTGLAFAPDRQSVLATLHTSRVGMFFIATGEWRELPPDIHAAPSLSWDGERIFTFDGENEAQIRNLDTLAVVERHAVRDGLLKKSEWLNDETVVASNGEGVLVFRSGEYEPEVHPEPDCCSVMAVSTHARMVCFGGPYISCWTISPANEAQASEAPE